MGSTEDVEEQTIRKAFVLVGTLINAHGEKVVCTHTEVCFAIMGLSVYQKCCVSIVYTVYTIFGQTHAFLRYR